MRAKVTYKGGMSFEGDDTRGHIVKADHLPDMGGADMATKPMEMFLMALGSCTGMDVVAYFRKRRQPLDFLEIHVEGERGEEQPKPFVKVRVEYVFKEGVSDKDATRAIDLSRTTYCPVMQMLEGSGAELVLDHRFV